MDLDDFDEFWSFFDLGGLTAHLIIKVTEMAYSMQDFLQKFEILTKIRDFHENSRFSQKSKIFAKI